MVVLSYSEDPSIAGQVAAAGLDVATALGTDALAVELDQVSPGLTASQDVLLVTGGGRLEDDPRAAASAIAELARANAFQAILVGDSRFGTIVGGMLAARLGVGSLGRCRQIQVKDGRITASRDVYGGRFLAEVSMATPCVIAVQQGAYEPRGGPPATRSVSHSSPDRLVKVIEDLPAVRSATDIKSAQAIVAVGRGFANRGDIAIAAELAATLGAALGCSRPLSSDLGWLGEDQHIGLTGAYVHPRLYVAVGISGQLQHVAGIRDSRTIVAINKDKQAPIFQVADYGVVGDLYEVLPELIRALKDR